MVLRSEENYVGARAFLVGVVLAVIIGVSTSSLLPFSTIAEYGSEIYGILTILGIVIGFTIDVKGKDSQTFLIAGAIIVIVSAFGMESAVGSIIGIGLGEVVMSTFLSMLILFAPVTVIVAVKTVFGMTRV